MSEFSFVSIKDYQTALLNNQTTCVAVVEYYLSRIEANKHLNAFLEVYSEEALERAKQLDEERLAGKSLGKLHGVVVGLKDVISYKNHKLSAASKILENYTAVYNATAVEKLLADGAIIIGRQNCDEFAMGSSNENSAFGKVLNAADNSRVPGGSSGGSAVAVQAGLCMISLGSDTGGSVRQPADFCGVIGLKPSYGRISRYGLIAYASSFDQIGIFSKTVEDAALVLEVIAGTDGYDSTVSESPVENYLASLTDDKKYKIAYIKQTLEHPSLNEEIKNAIFQFIEQLKSAGHSVEAIDFEYLDYIVPTYYVLTTAEASTNLSRYDGVRFGYQSKSPENDLTEFYKNNRSEAFGKEVKRRIMLGTFVLSALYYDSYFTKAQQVRRIVSDRANEIFAEYDALISPNSPIPAFKVGEKSNDATEMYLADIYTVFANLAGIPGISLPLFDSAFGIPFGIQIMTDKMKESQLLNLSKQMVQIAGKNF
ncbi:glutaminyl-tRNA synthase (glutamine-hydrolyzing) subunit A [Arachidicoccus ginsenosidimutans]|uniref:Asp-tRNA(Asn)/Glu-tRNA(Gln) amidotransferase subunit GatA n=1 Tax=Arachidicoccus sp. BS20 TaxID=1850526 RepID=UPI0007F086BB|nr:Asp-tRNA(Asn)/Glu-tRNA(Gln) amidotransferase subunit GatA [Arachidicoccus sp. BS20]ANI89162.1 glutaminyl-tRNA synthase (glutamine-hydrolyzing) subunit A [Arachidicoccus sp. BS20]